MATQAERDAVRVGDPVAVALRHWMANCDTVTDYSDAFLSGWLAHERYEKAQSTVATTGNWWELAWAIHEHVTAERAIPRELLPYFGGLELNGEAGELANLLKKDWRGDPGDRLPAIAEELADVAIVTSFLARDLGVDLEAAVLAKIEVLLDRWPSVRARMEADDGQR